MMLLNKAGAPEWEKYFGGNLKESLRRVRFDPCGRPELLFLTLSVLATTDGVAIPAPQPSSQAVASILAKLDPKDGRLLWAKGVAPGGNTDINGINQYDFGIELNGQSRVVGDFRGAVDLGGGQPASAVGGSHPYLIVYNP